MRHSYPKWVEHSVNIRFESINGKVFGKSDINVSFCVIADDISCSASLDDVEIDGGSSMFWCIVCCLPIFYGAFECGICFDNLINRVVSEPWLCRVAGFAMILYVKTQYSFTLIDDMVFVSTIGYKHHIGVVSLFDKCSYAIKPTDFFICGEHK